MDEPEIEVEFGSIPDDHISVWFAPLPEAVCALVRELLPDADLDRVALAVVVPTTRSLPIVTFWNYDLLQLGDRSIGGPDPFAVCTYGVKSGAVLGGAAGAAVGAAKRT